MCKKKKNIAKRLKDRFNHKPKYCYDHHRKKQPAYKCSGIIIRGVKDTRPNPPWALKPGNIAKKSFSVAFLREDTPFTGFPFGYDSGFIIYPHHETPKKKNTYKVFCAFPVDGWTDFRAGHRCGKNTGDGSGKSSHCDTQGITTYNKWKEHYRQVTSARGNFAANQCAFDMTKSTAAKDFAVVVKANSYLRKYTGYAFVNNELLFHAWNANNPKDLPIEAFFYLLNVPSSLEKAKAYQDYYYKRSGGEKIPIVGLRFPTKSNRNIHVEYFKRMPTKK